jgi:hypothetical protein
MIRFALQNSININIEVMKNLLKLSLVAMLFMLPVTSCNDYQNDEIRFFSKEYKIGSGKYTWTYDKIGDLFFCDVSIPELTSRIYEEGLLTGYFVYSIDGVKKDSPLPFSQFYMDDRKYQWEHQFTCEFSPGLVTFIFKDSNYAVDTAPVCTFAVKIMR